MMTMYMFQKIRLLVEQNKSDREIARELGINRKTVKKYRQTNAPPHYTSRTRPTREDPFQAFSVAVAAICEKTPSITADEVFMLIKAEGYRGSLRTIERRLARIKAAKPKERFFEQEYEPGEQAQFDFKEEVELKFVDGPRIVHLHFGTLPYSDFFAIHAYPFKNYEAFIDGVASFFETCGGLTKNIRFDNLAPCVSKVLRGSKRVYTEAFSKAANYYGFGLLPCSPGKGSDKGDVEREIRTQIRRLKNQISHTDKVFKDFSDLNMWLNDFCPRFRTEKTSKLWLDERRYLKPQPPRRTDILSKVITTLVTPYGTTRLSRSTYSVSDEHIGKAVRVVAGPFSVDIYLVGDDQRHIASHPRKPDGENSILLSHVITSLVRKPQAMVRWAHREILFPKPIFRRYYSRLQKKFGYDAERIYLKTINLIQHTTLSEIAAAIELWFDQESQTPFEDIRELSVGSGHRPAQVPEQTSLCPVLSFYDSLIPSPIEEVTNL